MIIHYQFFFSLQSNAAFLASSTKDNITFDDARQRSSPQKKNNRKPMMANTMGTKVPSPLRTSGKQAWKQQAFVDSNSDEDDMTANTRISKGTNSNFHFQLLYV